MFDNTFRPLTNHNIRCGKPESLSAYSNARNSTWMLPFLVQSVNIESVYLVTMYRLDRLNTLSI